MQLLYFLPRIKYKAYNETYAIRCMLSFLRWPLMSGRKENLYGKKCLSELLNQLSSNRFEFVGHIWPTFINEKDAMEFASKLNCLSEAYINGPYFDPFEL
mgnify:CR=1 FL=1